MQWKILSNRTTRVLTVALLAISATACNRIGEESRADPSPQPGPQPTKSDPRNVMPPGGPYASQADGELTSRVRMALRAERAVAGSDIAVSSVSGTVLLSGAVPPEQIPRAVELARAIEGVKQVDNRLLATG